MKNPNHNKMTDIKTYFELLPLELKLLLLAYDPVTSIDLCQELVTFNNACADTDYWNKLYHKEFSSFKDANFDKYVIDRLSEDSMSHYKTHLNDMIISGWDLKVIPLLAKRQDLFVTNNYEDIGYRLLEDAIRYQNVPVVKYLVDIKKGNLRNWLDLYMHYLSHSKNVDLLNYFISKGVMTKEYLNMLLQLIIDYDMSRDLKPFVEVLLDNGADVMSLYPDQQIILRNLLS